MKLDEELGLARRLHDGLDALQLDPGPLHAGAHVCARQKHNNSAGLTTGCSHAPRVGVCSDDGTCFGAELRCHSHEEGGENRRVIAGEDVIRATWQQTNPHYDYTVVTAFNML